MPGKRDATRISSRPGTTRPFSSPPHVRYRSEPGYASTQREQMVAGQAPPKRQPNGGGAGLTSQTQGRSPSGKQVARDAGSPCAEHVYGWRRRRNDRGTDAGREGCMWSADGRFPAEDRRPTRSRALRHRGCLRMMTGVVVATVGARAEDASTNALRACVQGLAGCIYFDGWRARWSAAWGPAMVQVSLSLRPEGVRLRSSYAPGTWRDASTLSPRTAGPAASA